MLSLSVLFLDFRFLSSASVLGLQLLSLCFFRSFFSPFSPHSGYSGSALCSRFLPFPLLSSLVSHAILPVLLYLASCWFPFVLPSFAPAAVPLVLPFRISPPESTLDFRFLSSASVLASHYSAICSSFSTLFPFLPHRWLSRCFRSALAFRIFPLLPSLVSHAFFPILCTWLSVSFFSSYPASLPTAVPLVITFRFRPRCFPLLFRFLSSASFPVLITQPSPFLFPSSPRPLAWVLRVLIYPFPFQPVAMPSVSLWYSAFLHFFSPLFCFATQVLLQLPTSCFQYGRSP